MHSILLFQPIIVLNQKICLLILMGSVAVSFFLAFGFIPDFLHPVHPCTILPHPHKLQIGLWCHQYLFQLPTFS